MGKSLVRLHIIDEKRLENGGFNVPEDIPDMWDETLLYECPLGLEGRCEGAKDKDRYESFCSGSNFPYINCDLYKIIIQGDAESHVKIVGDVTVMEESSYNHSHDYDSLHDRIADGEAVFEMLSRQPSFRRFTQR